MPGHSPALLPSHLHRVLLSDGRKLRLLQQNDPLKQWWSLDELRYCAVCDHLLAGRQIGIFEDNHERLHFRCPTHGCTGGFADWQYPRLHL